MFSKSFTPIIICLLTVGCASWFQQDGDKPVPYTPDAWYQQAGTSFSGATINAGYSEADITPFRGQWLAGYKVGRKSKTVVHPLRAQCLALQDRHNQKIMFVALDLVGILPDFIKGVLDQVSETSWPNERILFSSSHTHSAPDTYGVWGDGLIAIPLMDGKDPAYLERIQKDIAAAITRAAANLGPAAIRFATGDAPNCIARGQESAIPDKTIALLQVAIADNIVTLFNFGLQPNLNEGRYVSPDFVYFLRQYFEAQTNGRMMFVNGANGAVQPNHAPVDCDSSYQYQGRWVRAREIGEELAREAITILQSPIVPSNGDIHVKKADLEVEVKSWVYKTAVRFGLLPRITDSSQNWKIKPTVYYVQIGPAQMLTAPGELFPERWGCIKPKLTGQPLFMLGLTNVNMSYIMSEKDFNSGDFPYHAGMINIGDPKFGENFLQVYDDLIDSGIPIPAVCY